MSSYFSNAGYTRRYCVIKSYPMKRNLYTPLQVLIYLILLFAITVGAQAQSCSGLAVVTTAAESRCMATGTIVVQVTGGSGNYNYKAVGPVTTSFTSSNVITGLQPGAYKVTVRDITNACEVEKENVVVSGTYSDPRFVLSKTDVSCAANDGTISVSNRQFGREPFSYTIVAPSPAGVGTTNTTGAFTNLIAGAYAVQLKDSCGGIQVRRVTIQDYTWWFDGVTVTKRDCDTADVVIRLKDNKGNLNSNLSAFAGFAYGVINAPGDTTWHTANRFSIFIRGKRSVKFVARDACGRLHTDIWNVPASLIPTVSAINYSNLECSGFTVALSGRKNLTDPVYLLFDSTNTRIDSNATGLFLNVPYGNNCIYIIDACYDTTIVRCFSKPKPAPTVAGIVTISDRICGTFTATITGQANLFAPSFCLYDGAGVLVGCNSSGIFTNIPYGSYCIKTTDSCTSAVFDRCFTVSRPVAVLSNYNISGQNCNTFDVTVRGDSLNNPRYCLYDLQGNVVRCDTTGTFTGLPNGSYCVRAISCGDTTAPVCFSGWSPIPDAAPGVQMFNQACSTFSAVITGQINWTNPQYCLYDSADVQIGCNTTGAFDSLAYGSYCIKITDGCYDTTIVRCFVQTRSLPAVNTTMQMLNITCSTFTAKITDPQYLFDPQYCIYDAADSLLACNTTGVFDSLAYGSYCVVATDGCSGASVRICQSFTSDYQISLTATKSCTIGYTNVFVSFTSGTSPYRIRVYDPVDSVVHGSSATATKRIGLPALKTGEMYKVIATDACGRSDTAFIMPQVSTFAKTISAAGKCPSANWLNGSGDMYIAVSSNLGTVTPAIIKKDGTTFSKTHSSNAGSSYVFSDLEPASYIVEYRIQNCVTRLYDTFAIEPYAYPAQGRSAIYQCDNQSISLTADVRGGVGPYQYQIIGSEPETPTIISSEQASAIFNINNGTNYSLIRLRTVDACGNATLNDVSVLPLQNILITADTTCLYSNITLSVDTIQEAVYSWYKKLDVTDSVLVSNDKSYNIPFMQQEHIGTYICKVELNNSCLTRLASFNLAGYCGEIFLAQPLKLTGKATFGGNMLRWNTAGLQMVQYYEVERSPNKNNGYKPVGRLHADPGAGPSLSFTDGEPAAGLLWYRVKAVHANGTHEYSNSIGLRRESHATDVYPNPVHSVLNIQINGTTTCDYRIELFDMSGRTVYEKELQQVTSIVYKYQRPARLQNGMYVLKITNRTTGAISHRKMLFY